MIANGVVGNVAASIVTLGLEGFVLLYACFAGRRRWMP